MPDQPLESFTRAQARERVVDLTVDGDAQRDTHTERDMPAVTSDLRASYRHAADAGPDAREPLPSEPSIDQVVGDIPLESPGFRPRSAQLAELDQAGARISVIQAVAGRQGVGATQLAAAYARAKLAAGWRLVAWVNGLDSGSLTAGLAAVADAMGLVDDDSGLKIADAARSVRYWLEADGDRCLLVFDDVADPEELRPFIPVGGTARVVITSARPSALNLGPSVSVDVFSTADAAEFLDCRTGLADAEGAAAVAAELGQLPLALAHAAVVMTGQRLTYWGYLDRLRALPGLQDPVRHETQPHQRSVAGAVLLSLQAVQVSDRTGICSRVLEITAVLSAAGVRRELLHVAGRAGVLVSGRQVAPSTVDRALEWLSGRSLLTFSLDGQTVITHRLVAQGVRDSLARRQRLMAVRVAAARVLDTYAQALVGSQDRPAVRGIPQHVTALLDSMAEPSAEADGELARVLLRLRFIALYHLIELRDSAPQAIAIGEPLTADLERLLGPDHPDTLNAQNSLAAAYMAVGGAGQAIPLLEQVLAVRQRLLGSDHPDTLNSQNNLAAAYQDAARAAEAIPHVEQTLSARADQPAADAAEELPANGLAPPSATLTGDRSPGRAQGPPPADVQRDREVATAIAAGDPAGIAQAYDRYAAALYGYCCWMLRDPADAAAALQDTFVIAATASGDLSDASKLRPWLYAVARSQCRRRPLAAPAARDEKADAANQQAEPVPGPPRAPVSHPADAPVSHPADATVTFAAVRPAPEPVSDAADATVTFAAVRPAPEPVSDPPDATVTFAAVRPQTYVIPEMLVATRPPPEPTNASPQGDGELEQAELWTLIRSILADLKPREREAIELSFRHNLYDNDLAMALGVSWSRAHARVVRAQTRLDKALGALHIALTRRDVCPVLAEILADWDGQLTEQTRDLAARHIAECQACANHSHGAVRPAAFSHLLPLAPLPPELRGQVLSRCTSTSSDAVAYRRRVARRAKPTWFSRFLRFSRRSGSLTGPVSWPIPGQ